MNCTKLVAILGLLCSSASAAPHVADLDGQPPTGLHVDVEVDPTAFVFDGHSLHLGLGRGRFRIDLGAFAMRVPHALDGNEGFTRSFSGFGAKLQYFLFDEARGGFVGLDAGVASSLIERDGTDMASNTTQVIAGVNVGWRWRITDRLYASTWISLDRNLNARDIVLDSSTYKASRWTVFPAIHLGYRFQ
jgi:hypothetical protein